MVVRWSVSLRQHVRMRRVHRDGGSSGRRRTTHRHAGRMMRMVMSMGMMMSMRVMHIDVVVRRRWRRSMCVLLLLLLLLLVVSDGVGVLGRHRASARMISKHMVPWYCWCQRRRCSRTALRTRTVTGRPYHCIATTATDASGVRFGRQLRFRRFCWRSRLGSLFRFLTLQVSDSQSYRIQSCTHGEYSIKFSSKKPTTFENQPRDLRCG